MRQGRSAPERKRTQQAYTIWARALGQPGGNASITTCGTDLTGAVICSTEKALLVRGHGQQTFKDVTTELTQIDTTLGTISLFTTGFENFFWSYDNNGLRLAQVRPDPSACLQAGVLWSPPATASSPAAARRCGPPLAAAASAVAPGCR